MKALLFLIFSLTHASAYTSLALAEVLKYQELLKSEGIRMRLLEADFTVDLDTMDKAKEQFELTREKYSNAVKKL